MLDEQQTKFVHTWKPRPHLSHHALQHSRPAKGHPATTPVETYYAYNTTYQVSTNIPSAIPPSLTTSFTSATMPYSILGQPMAQQTTKPVHVIYVFMSHTRCARTYPSVSPPSFSAGRGSASSLLSRFPSHQRPAFPVSFGMVHNRTLRIRARLYITLPVQHNGQRRSRATRSCGRAASTLQNTHRGVALPPMLAMPTWPVCTTRVPLRGRLTRLALLVQGRMQQMRRGQTEKTHDLVHLAI